MVAVLILDISYTRAPCRAQLHLNLQEIGSQKWRLWDVEGEDWRQEVKKTHNWDWEFSISWQLMTSMYLKQHCFFLILFAWLDGKSQQRGKSNNTGKENARYPRSSCFRTGKLSPGERIWSKKYNNLNSFKDQAPALVQPSLLLDKQTELMFPSPFIMASEKPYTSLVLSMRQMIHRQNSIICPVT